MMDTDKFGGMGWERDLPDFRDYVPESPEVKAVLAKSQPLKAAKSALPKSVDLRQWCTAPCPE